MCGKGNESYTGTCACGNTKRENAAFISAEAQRKWSEKSVTSDADKAVLDKNAKEKAAAEALLAFKELLDKGAITQEEYDLKKKQLLGL
ncbi:MAG: SHOCT domain-containing protein [Lachnospiraceae bacterium]|nr:SHOCT domain-containing protein [Lachnospiraceae bacterium]